MGQVTRIFGWCEMSVTWNERVGQRRRYLGLTKTELSKRCGVSQPTANQWESGEITETSASNFDRLAEVLEVTVDWLRFGVEQENRDILHGLTKAQKNELFERINQLRLENEAAIAVAEELRIASNGN